MRHTTLNDFIVFSVTAFPSNLSVLCNSSIIVSQLNHLTPSLVLFFFVVFYYPTASTVQHVPIMSCMVLAPKLEYDLKSFDICIFFRLVNASLGLRFPKRVTLKFKIYYYLSGFLLVVLPLWGPQCIVFHK